MTKQTVLRKQLAKINKSLLSGSYIDGRTIPFKLRNLLDDALDQIDDLVAACETALAVGEIQFKTCALSAGAHEKLINALAKVYGQEKVKRENDERI